MGTVYHLEEKEVLEVPWEADLHTAKDNKVVNKWAAGLRNQEP